MNIHSIIKKPLVTEKSSRLKETANQYCFAVHERARKLDIRRAIEKLFNVKVKEIKTMRYMGKTKRVGRHVGRRSNWKKAVVTLEKGATIEFFEGV